MNTLPLLVGNPVRHDDGALHLVVPGRAPIALIKPFNDGWQAVSLFTLFDPLWVLVLRHQNGETACWYITDDGLFTTVPHHWPRIERLGFGRRLQQVALWLHWVAGAPIRIPVPEAVLAYLGLPANVQNEFDSLLDQPLAPFVASLVAGTPSDALALRDSLAGEAPDLVFRQVENTRGYLIGNPGALVPMGTGDTLAELQAGWQVEAVRTVFAPLLSVVLHHEDGRRATWFIDLHGRVVGHQAGLLPPELTRHLAGIIAPVLDTLWTAVALGRGTLHGISDELAASLPPGDLNELVPHYLDSRSEDPKPRVWTLDEPPPPGLGYVVPTDAGLRVYDETSIVRLLMHGLHSEMDRLLRTGRMRWPSPVDGSMVESDGFALLLHQNCFAYRFRDEAAGLVFYVVCTGTHFYNYGIYFPTANLLVTRTAAMAADCLRHLSNGRETILRHLLMFREQLIEAERTERDDIIQQFFGGCAVHIGHYVWQDLSGLTYLLRNVAADRPLPHLQLFSSGSTHQYFGPEERIFPMFADRLTRHEASFGSHIGDFYRRNQRVITYTAISVPAETRDFVRAAADATPELRPARLAADAAAARLAPVVLIGLRVGNRTMDDMEAFAVDLLEHLSHTFPGCTVILDGLNDAHDRGGDAWPDTAPGCDLDTEFAIGRRLETIAAGLDVTFVNLINHSALRSALWCSRADCFVAPLGAALAKYRWICNTPGVVLTSCWNLDSRPDLHIYDAPAAVEGTSEMLFNSRDHVRDLTPELDAGGYDGRGNFIVERAPVFAQVTDLVRRHAGRRIEALAQHAPSLPSSSLWAAPSVVGTVLPDALPAAPPGNDPVAPMLPVPLVISPARRSGLWARYRLGR